VKRWPEAGSIKAGTIAIAFVAISLAARCLGQAASQDATAQIPNQQLAGSISGLVVDQSGAFVAGAQVQLSRPDEYKNPQLQSNQSEGPPVITGHDGQFLFTNVAPGPFHLTFTSAGFAQQAFSGTLAARGNYLVPQIALDVATAVTEVQVRLTRTEVAEEEIKVEEKQRVLGVIPNFYVSYISDPVPLSSRQKFEIAWKTVLDPVTFVLVGGIAGVEQAQNHFSGYGQGAQGYAKRYGAGYADTITGTFIGSAILPSLLKQDPRYFYKGTGGTHARILYALANSVICKGDNGRWQANYSNILGNLAAGGISNLYYPAQDRNGAGLTFENAGIGIGATAIANLFQEFVVRKFTPKIPNRNSATDVPDHTTAKP
jgi:Carboxypeptidase regulatory-like domain